MVMTWCQQPKIIIPLEVKKKKRSKDKKPEKSFNADSFEAACGETPQWLGLPGCHHCYNQHHHCHHCYNQHHHCHHCHHCYNQKYSMSPINSQIRWTLNRVFNEHLSTEHCPKKDSRLPVQLLKGEGEIWCARQPVEMTVILIMDHHIDNLIIKAWSKSFQ